MKNREGIKTLGELKKSGYTSKKTKQELRDNLITVLKNKENPFDAIKGFEDTVIPQIQSAILSQHNFILLGLRGQAKTKIARLVTNLLDDFVPIVAGSEINDDPLDPLSYYAIKQIEELGDNTPITWLHRNDRYTEKLATPDVSVADLIGDLDPIKAASLKLSYADERVIHYGLIPRSHRCIFVINELPDLQARIQVALFNILQEGDIQIRGFKLRLPLDIGFVFTANPEDYTNRGSIVTPLKDRIGSQILTHYPNNIETASAITKQEANISEEQKQKINVDHLIYDLIEQISFEARESEYIDQKSGVSARLTISALENLYSAAERRMLLNGENETNIRISDLYNVIPSITGKVELVYEGELEGISSVAYNLIGKAIRTQFANYFPDPELAKKSKEVNPYTSLLNWFSEGNEIELQDGTKDKNHCKSLNEIPYLKELVNDFCTLENEDHAILMMEFAMHGLAEYSQISKKQLDRGLLFKDLMSGMLNFHEGFEDEDDYE